MPETADGDGSSSFALVLPVRPGWEGNLASITLTGPGGSVTLDGESNLPMAILRNPRTGQVRGILRNVPPPTQAAMDADGSRRGTGLGGCCSAAESPKARPGDADRGGRRSQSSSALSAVMVLLRAGALHR